MADCGFHSPHFSEEPAYLPPWLHPRHHHHLPKDVICCKEDVRVRQSGGECLSTEKDGLNSCCLYLSEDTCTLHGSTPSDDNQAFHLSLHLSCTLSQDKDPPQTSNYEISKCACTEPTIEAQETQTDKTKGHMKSTKKDTLTLSQADIEEAIELSIAASEAMVITEVVSLDSDESQFAVSNALEAALRVKEARREMSEIASGASLEQDEESDSLSDLDELAMAAAYADAGVSDKWAPDSNSNIHSLDNYRGSTLVPCSIKESTSSLQIFNLKNPTLNEENATAVETEKDGPDNSDGIQKSSKELEGSPEGDKKVAVQGKTCTRIIREPFIRESSFLSESMDTSGFPFAPVEEHGIEIVASCTPTNAKAKCLNEGVFSSIDALCSGVPCSLSNPCMDQISNGEKIPVDLQEILPRLQNVQDSAGLVKRTVSTLQEYSVGIRDVQSNKAPQTFDKKPCNNVDVLVGEVCGDMNSSHRDLKTRVVVETVGSKNKRVRFLDGDCIDKEAKRSERMKHKITQFSSKSRIKGVKDGLNCASRIRKRKCSSFAGDTTERQEMIFQGLNFLLTGLSNMKLRELQALIRRYGGCVLTKLPDCPSHLRPKLVESTHWRPPVVICPKKVATGMFLYGCAIDSWVLHPQWVVDSVQAGHLLPPSKYLVRQLRESAHNYLDKDIFCFRRHTHIFHGMGFLLYGKLCFSSKHSNIIKHGGGVVFQSLQSLVRSLTAQIIRTGIILVENDARSSRHLTLCALEHNIQTVPVNWITKTLYAGELAPFKKEDHDLLFGRIKVSKRKNVRAEAFDMSQEI